MNWTGRARLWGCAVTLLAMAGCSAGSAPNDVREGVGFSDYQEYQARRAALRNPGPTAAAAAPPSVPQTVLPPTEVAAEPFAPQTPLRGAWVASDATAQARTGAATAPGTDVARIAAAAIDRADAGTVAAAAPAPAQGAAADPGGLPPVTASGDAFTAPPLPDNIPVLGARVVAFALSTSHPVGQRMWARNPLRLGGGEVECRDFRTTDIAQDWFLSNGGPERDRSGLDRDGDGFACNWSPERYRAEAREARGG